MPELELPDRFELIGNKTIELRYGENPHQKPAVFYAFPKDSAIKNLHHLGGQKLSYVNLIDIDAGIKAVRLFEKPAVVVIKHGTLCGGALGVSIAEALFRAIESDPTSTFGGTVVPNKPMTPEATEVMTTFKSEQSSHVDIFAGPEIPQDLADQISALKKNRGGVGVYQFGDLNQYPNQEYKFTVVDGGFTVQPADDDFEAGFATWMVATEVQPTEHQLEQMRIGWKFASRIRSNTIVVMDRDIEMMRGIGGGQVSRIGAAEIALAHTSAKILENGRRSCEGGILISDSFFPKDDVVRLAATYGISAIIQQKGALHEADSIRAANEFGISMVLTDRRAFWH